MVRKLKFCLSIAIAIFFNVCVYAADLNTFDRNAWLEDFSQLEQMISTTYPNLDSQVASQKLNLVKLDHEVRNQLEAIVSDQDAMRVLNEFISKFKDGHLRLETTESLKNDPTSPSQIAKATPGLEACELMMGKWTSVKKIEFGFPVSKKDRFKPVKIQDSAFPWTTFNIGKKRIGIVRIVSFGQGDYPPLCADEWIKYRATLKNACDQKCQDIFVHEVLPNRLIRDFEIVVKEIKKEHVSALVLDLSDNGGGTGWVGAVMRILTTKKILCGTFGFIRHPHWVKNFEAERDEFQAKLKSASDEASRKMIQSRLKRISADLIEARKVCDRRDIWSDGKFHPTCQLVVERNEKDCNPGDELHFVPGLFDGPLFVIANRKTASASEDLVARYKESGIATIIGEKTRGSGCGFTNGGIELKLKNSGVRVYIPDCARLLRDGTNEVAGIAPDIVLPMNDIQTDGFVTKLKSVITKILH